MSNVLMLNVKTNDAMSKCSGLYFSGFGFFGFLRVARLGQARLIMFYSPISAFSVFFYIIIPLISPSKKELLYVPNRSHDLHDFTLTRMGFNF